MNTRRSYDDVLLVEAFARVESASADTPIADIITQLQLVVERLTFSALHERTPQNDPGVLAEIDLYFRGEVSDSLVEFVQWAAGAERLSALSGEDGRIFLDRCMTTYRGVQEVRMTTAVDLTQSERQQMRTRLRAIYPEPARIMFDSASWLIAGFILTSGNTTVDKSLRTHVSTSVSRTGKLHGMTGDDGVRIG